MKILRPPFLKKENLAVRPTVAKKVEKDHYRPRYQKHTP